MQTNSLWTNGDPIEAEKTAEESDIHEWEMMLARRTFFSFTLVQNKRIQKAKNKSTWREELGPENQESQENFSQPESSGPSL